MRLFLSPWMRALLPSALLLWAGIGCGSGSGEDSTSTAVSCEGSQDCDGGPCVSGICAEDSGEDTPGSRSDRDTGSPHGTGEGLNPFADPGSAALALASMDGCMVDADCTAGMFCFQQLCAVECRMDGDCQDDEFCSTRGRCSVVAEGPPGASAIGSEPPARDQVLSGITFSEMPPTLALIQPRQRRVRVTVPITGPAPESGLLYRIERNDALNTPEEVLRITPNTEGELEFDIPVGGADPDGENLVVSVRFILPFDSFRILLQPAEPAAGEYVGEVFMDGFGSTGLPIELRVHTTPPRASLADATSASLALRVAREHLFSPLDAHDPTIEWVAAPLAFDAFTERWVATFSYEFQLAQSSRLVAYAIGQIQRQLRFELDAPEGGLLVGRVVDRWRGLFDQRSALGAPEVGVVRFDGDLEATWQGVVHASDLPAPLELDPPAPSLLPPPAITACGDVDFAIPGDGDTPGPCEGIPTGADFADASLEAQLACTDAIARAALEGPTTSALIAAFLEDEPDASITGGISFAEFMERCAAGTDGACVATDEIVCSRELIAHAFHNFGSATSQQRAALASLGSDLIAHYQNVTREAYFGRQLGAFQTDVNTRLRWLRDSDLPAIVTSAVQSTTEGLLNEWQTNVLEVHMDTLAGQFDPAGIVMLGIAASGDASLSARRRLLAETMQSWRGTLDALTLAAQRWDGLLQDEFKRAEKAAFVAGSMLDLYLTAGMLAQFNREAGSGFQNASLAGGFASLIRQLNRLSLSFEELIYARDAEVVTSNSLNPREDSDSLINRLRTDAERELDDAATAISDILDQVRAEALSQTLLRQNFTNTIRDLRAELAELCGIPVGCSASEARTEVECMPRTEAGECGFALERGTLAFLPFAHPQFLASEGGRAQLEIVSALQGIRIARAELQAHQDRVSLETTELERFAREIEAWNSRRLVRITRMRMNFDQRGEIRDERLAALLTNLESRAIARAAAIEDFQTSIAEWDRIRTQGATADFAWATAQVGLTSVAEGLRNTAELISDTAEALSEAVPRSVGTSNDTTFAARFAALATSAKVSFGMRTTALGLDALATANEIRAEYAAAMREAELENLEDESTLEQMISQNELETLEGALRSAEALSANQLAALEETLQLLIAEDEAVDAYQRDLDAFRQRRLALWQRMTDNAELSLRVEQAQMRVQQRMMEYLQITERSSLIAARLADVEEQLQNVEILIGSPSAVFNRANRLAQAESRLDRAKSAMMDWLVALEYYAVRPFMDQRLQILLARNTFQLEEIMGEMRRLENSCGGAINQETAEFSVREDFLGLVTSIEDVVTEEILTPEARFRSVLSAGVVPVDKRIRFTTDSTIGELMRTDQGILAATFSVNLNDYGNLATTCNAKIAGIRIQLVGEGLGNARPVVNLLYDGTSQLRSCQPGIDQLVASYGPGTTSFGSITTLRTRGRSIGPIAGINDFTDTDNVTLAGLPLSSQYTVLINPNIGENQNIDWDKVDDIRLRITYAYQDLFPQGQCQ